MAFLRKKTKDGISIGMAYSIFQKCVRRCMVAEALHYGMLIYNDGTPNSLRKRLVQSCLEDMSNWHLALEIYKCDDSELENYIYIVTTNKKTHISAWFQRVALHYAIYNINTNNSELELGIKMHKFASGKKYKDIRSFLGKDGSKLYSFMGKERLVWAVYILKDTRPELNYNIDRNIETIKSRNFFKLPNWVLDKHVPGGTPGYQFFFDNSCKMNNRIYLETEDYEVLCQKLYLIEEKRYGRKARTKHSIERWLDGSYKIKQYIPKILVENSFENIIQIQLLTRKNFPKVYFTTLNNKKYVLKGPINETMKKQIKFTEKIKKLLKLNHLNIKFLELQYHDKTSTELWMICDSLVNYHNHDNIIKTSKIESERPIYNGLNANANFDILILHL